MSGKTTTKKTTANKTTANKTTAKKAAKAPAKVSSAKAAQKAKKTTAKPAAKVVAGARRPRTKPIIEDPDNLVVDAHDYAAQDIVAQKKSKKAAVRSKRTAVDRLNDPPPETGLALIERVSRAIERELTQIEIIVGGHRVPAAQRSEAERRARTLASLARTLNEVRRLRDGEERTKAGDDANTTTLPRDLDELRRELSRRLAGLDESAAQEPAGGDERSGA